MNRFVPHRCRSDRRSFERTLSGPKALIPTLAFTVLLGACDGLFVAPSLRSTGLAVSFSMAAAAGGDAQAFDMVDAANIRITRRTDGGIVFDDDVVLGGSPGGDRSASIEIDVGQNVDILDVTATLMTGGQPVFEGTGETSIRQGQVASVDVALDPVIATIQLTTSVTTLTAIGQAVPLHAAAFFATGDTVRTASVEWTSLDPTIASVTQDGVVTARREGATQILATAGGATATMNVRVQAIVSTVDVDPAAASVDIGNDLTLTANARDANGNTLARTAQWRTGNAAVATVTTGGVVHGQSSGQVTITATIEGQSGTAVITVVPGPVASVTVEPSAATISAGESIQFTAVSRTASGAVVSRPIQWSSSDPLVASVGVTGLVQGEGVGTALIRATSEGVTGEAEVTVTPAVVVLPDLRADGIAVNPTSPTITQSFTVQGSVSNVGAATAGPFFWRLRIGSTTVASGQASGLVANGTATFGSTAITPYPAGNHTVTMEVDYNNAVAESNESNNTSQTSFTVRTIVAAVLVSPNPVSLNVDQSVQLTATAYSPSGAVITGQTFTWSSSNSAVAVVNSTGRVTAVGAGSATVSATTAGVTGSTTVRVTALLPDLRITTSISASPKVVFAGQGVTLSDWVVTNSGNAASGNFSNGFYLSTNSIISVADTYLDGNSNFSLSPGQSFAWGGPTLTIPNVAPGTYYLGILVDRLNSVAESNEGNNYVSVPITVDVLIKPPGSTGVMGDDSTAVRDQPENRR